VKINIFRKRRDIYENDYTINTGKYKKESPGPEMIEFAIQCAIG